MVTKIYTDGSGESSHIGGKFCAVFIKDETKADEVDFVQYRESETKLTCNEAEYHAILLALEERKHKEKIEIISDSKLVVNQLRPVNPWNINFEHLKILNSLVKDIIENFQLEIELKWVPRDQNLAGLYFEGKLKVPNDKILTEW